MTRLKLWQWVILATPIASIIAFLAISAGLQIHQWGISWIWAIFTLVFVGWRWLLVTWTQPIVKQLESVVKEVSKELEDRQSDRLAGDEATKQAETALQNILQQTRNDAPIWQDWPTFWQRCQEVVIAVSRIYYPEVRYPLLNIYIPQAYALIRGTVDDMDRWMQQLSPALNKVTVGQVYQAYEVYQKLEPSARKLLQIWNWAQWILNPALAVAKRASKRYSDRATDQLLINISQMLREVALRNLCQQAIALYGNAPIPNLDPSISTAGLPQAQTQTLRDIIAQSEPTENLEQKPVNILLTGRTGAGKSSLINTLFQADKAEVDLLPSTDKVQNYNWQLPTGETLTLWDTPGYEQIDRSDLREQVLDYGKTADLLLLVTPALDPALQMDADFVRDIKGEIADLPAIAIVTQVDRLRPLREWEPPYDWQTGDRPKEKAIREATKYRAELLEQVCQQVLPIVTSDINTNRTAWNRDALSMALIEAIAPTKQLRLARFLRDREARTLAAAKVIDRYTLQMATTQGLTSLLKSPVLQFLSTLSTGSPNLAYILAEKIPVEQLPIVIGKLQMAYDLYSLLGTGDSNKLNFDLLSLWPLLLENPEAPERNAWAFGHALVEYWTQNLTVVQLKERFEFYLQQV